MGGGFGADYTSGYSPDAASYGEAIIPHLKDLAVKLILEPGKSIAANSGILLTEVLYRKTGGNKSFVITDSGMNDLLRPPLYDAFHFIWPVRVADKHLPSGMEKIMNLPDLETVDIVGPVCEGSDFFAKGGKSEVGKVKKLDSPLGGLPPNRGKSSSFLSTTTPPNCYVREAKNRYPLILLIYPANPHKPRL